MRLVAIALIAGCSSMPDVNGNTLGESGAAKLSVAPGQTTVNALGTDLIVTNTGDGASGAIGARLVDDDAGWFAITHSDCSELQPGATCAVGVAFAPGGASTTGKTTLEIDDNNEPATTAALDGKIMPAIRWQEMAAPLSSQDCTTAGPSEIISTTIHLLYAGLAVGGVQITPSDSHYGIVNGCIGATGTIGKCDVTVQVKRGDMGATPPAQVTITAQINGLSAAIGASYQLQSCDLTLAPDPLKLDPLTSTGTITLTNRSTTTSHTIGSAVLGNNPVLTVPEATCKQGLTLAPQDSCTARVLYTPSTMPKNDTGSVLYTVTTSDMEPLAVTGTIQVGINNNNLHFEKDAYSWDDVATGSTPVPMALKVLTDAGVMSAGPLTVSMTNSAWVIDNGTIGTCAAPFSATCTFSLDFTGSAMSGTTTGLVIAKDAAGNVAVAALKAKVN